MTSLNLKAVNSEDSIPQVLTIFERRQRELFINHLDGLKLVLEGAIRSSKAQAYLAQIQLHRRIGRKMGPLQEYIKVRLNDVRSEAIGTPYNDINKMTLDILHNEAVFIQSNIDDLILINDNLKLAYQYEIDHIFQLYQVDNMRPFFQDELVKRGYRILQSVLDETSREVLNLKQKIELNQEGLGMHKHDEVKIALKYEDPSYESVEEILGSQYFLKLINYEPQGIEECLDLFLHTL